MEGNVNAEELVEFMRRVRSREMMTNSFFLPTQLPALLAADGVICRIGESLAVFIVPEEGLDRLYFYARNEMSLGELAGLVDGLDTSRVVCDVIVNQPDDHVVELMEKSGMKHYTNFTHFRCENIPSHTDLDLTDVESAATGDAEQILGLIVEAFDSKSAHFPAIEEILRDIEAKEINVIHNDGRVVAFAYFSTKRYQTLLRFYVVRDGYRGKHLAEKVLLAKMVPDFTSRFYELWVESTNRYGIQRHIKNGFKEDGKTDYIFTF